MHKITRLNFTFALALLAMIWCSTAAFSHTPAAQAEQPSSRQQPAYSQSEPGKTAGAAKTEAISDERFVKDEASGGMAEVKFGQLAEEKSNNDTVKNFGKRMVDDHSKANEDLKAVAAKSNIKLPSKLNAKEEATYNRLSRLSGTAFDREYAKEMVTDHTHDVAAFRKEALDGKNDSIKAFASKTLPTLQDHLKQAREMEKAVSSEAANRAGIGSDRFGK